MSRSPTAADARPMDLRYFDDDDVSATARYPEVLTALRSSYLSAHRGVTLSIPKTMQRWETGDGPASAHALGAVDIEHGVGAFKCWVNTPRGAQALLTLFDAEAGRLVALVAAGALGLVRTAGTAALATDLLALPDASVLAVLGTGRQAVHQVTATAQVRQLELVRVWSPNADRRRDFAEHIAGTHDLRVEASPDPESAVADVPIVITVTRAHEPFLDAAMLTRGAHVNAIGAILPGNAELLPNVVETSDLVVVDDLENARRSATELRPLGPDLVGVLSLGELIDASGSRPDGAGLTLFKGVGTGIADLAVARLFTPAG
jgi:alanine dehydrogenase